jgi:hypothetical protein
MIFLSLALAGHDFWVNLEIRERESATSSQKRVTILFPINLPVRLSIFFLLCSLAFLVLFFLTSGGLLTVKEVINPKQDCERSTTGDD